MADEFSFFVDTELIERLLAGSTNAASAKIATLAGEPNITLAAPNGTQAAPGVEQKTNPDRAAELSLTRPVEPEGLSQALVLERDGKPAEALAAVIELIGHGESTPDLYWVKGHLHFALDQFAEAAESYGKAGSIDPKHQTAFYNQGLAFERLGQFEPANTAFTQAAENDAERWQPKLGLGICALQLKNFPVALEQFDAVLRAEPTHEQALLGKAFALLSLHRVTEAGALYEYGIAIKAAR